MTNSEKATVDVCGKAEEALAKDVDVENAAEETERGDTFDAVATTGIAAKMPSKTTRQQQKRVADKSRLSIVSKNYDLDGTGTLDEVEKMMRAYDTNNDGQLGMREIYKIVRDLRAQQKELDHERKMILDMKRVIIFLCIFTLVLSLAMLGVSFAAAKLAKDTTVSSTQSLADKASGESLSTINAARMNPFHFATNGTEEPGRRLFVSSKSWIGREMQRRLNKQYQKEYDRNLRASFVSRGNQGSNKDNNKVSTRDTHSDNEVDLDKCNRVIVDNCQDVKRSLQNGEKSLSFTTTEGGLKYTKTLDVMQVLTDTNDDTMMIETAMECDSQPVYVLKHNTQSECELYGCDQNEETSPKDNQGKGDWN